MTSGTARSWVIFVQPRGRCVMNISRSFYVYFWLAHIFVTHHVKKIVRRFGEWMKVEGRVLVAWGDDVTPRWSRELFQKCYLANVEVHSAGLFYSGCIENIYQEYSGKDALLVIKCKVSENVAFKLAEYRAPVPIKEGGYDCIWFMYRDGYVVIHFRARRRGDKK